jgi:hypothetical protein
MPFPDGVPSWGGTHIDQAASRACRHRTTPRALTAETIASLIPPGRAEGPVERAQPTGPTDSIPATANSRSADRRWHHEFSHRPYSSCGRMSRAVRLPSLLR